MIIEKEIFQPSEEQERPPESGEDFELNAGKEIAIAKFKEFADKYRQEVEEFTGKGKALEDIFYYGFYSANIDNPKYKENDPAFSDLKKGYEKSIEKIQKRFPEEQKKKESEPVVKTEEYWIRGDTGGVFPVNRPDELGRIYLGVKSEKMPEFFQKAIGAFGKTGLHTQIKIPIKATAQALNRRDRCLFYFCESEEERILEKFEKLHNKHNDWFEESDLPLFTAQMKDKQGGKMKGVSFAQNTVFRHGSFGGQRAKVLADVYEEAKKKGLSVSDAAFNFNETFEKACQRHFVDPQSPCFNLEEKGKEKFPLVRERLRKVPVEPSESQGKKIEEIKGQ